MEACGCLVALPVFKTEVPEDLGQAGSIPVRLRFQDVCRKWIKSPGTTGWVMRLGRVVERLWREARRSFRGRARSSPIQAGNGPCRDLRGDRDRRRGRGVHVPSPMAPACGRTQGCAFRAAAAGTPRARRGWPACPPKPGRRCSCGTAPPTTARTRAARRLGSDFSPSRTGPTPHRRPAPRMPDAAPPRTASAAAISPPSPPQQQPEPTAPAADRTLPALTAPATYDSCSYRPNAPARRT